MDEQRGKSEKLQNECDVGFARVPASKPDDQHPDESSRAANMDEQRGNPEELKGECDVGFVKVPAQEPEKYDPQSWKGMQIGDQLWNTCKAYFVEPETERSFGVKVNDYYEFGTKPTSIEPLEHSRMTSEKPEGLSDMKDNTPTPHSLETPAGERYFNSLEKAQEYLRDMMSRLQTDDPGLGKIVGEELSHSEGLELDAENQP
jgi:hypothetical protein